MGVVQKQAVVWRTCPKQIRFKPKLQNNAQQRIESEKKERNKNLVLATFSLSTIGSPDLCHHSARLPARTELERQPRNGFPDRRKLGCQELSTHTCLHAWALARPARAPLQRCRMCPKPRERSEALGCSLESKFAILLRRPGSCARVSSSDQ